MCNWMSENTMNPRIGSEAIHTVLGLYWCQAVSQIWAQKLEENKFHLIILAI